ncbi:hypothetical protein, partial [Streptomyces sp. SID9124]|uniref:hypothetical protein n=1 Tax=Streptomyces sp. SID9124 TaxID=2706108 RepID=UPI0013DF3D4F
VASLACCAIGGVAVAAGSGMLPAPFGRHTPSPATSVSAAASPEELGAEAVPDEETSAPPPPGTPSPDAPPPGSGRGTGKDKDTARPEGGAPQGGRGGKDDGTTGTDRTDGSRSGDGTGSGDAGSDEGDGDGDGASDPGKGTGRSGGNGGSGSGTWYAKSLKACRDYREGKLDDDRRTRLEALAKGARNLDRFCDRLLDGKGGQGGQGDDRSGDPADADGDHGGDASGRLPSIRFSESPGPSTAALAPAPEPSGSTAADDAWATAGAAAR